MTWLNNGLAIHDICRGEERQHRRKRKLVKENVERKEIISTVVYATETYEGERYDDDVF